MKHGIYCIENKINHKKYVGKSRNIDKRIKDHIYNLRNNIEGCKVLQNAWNKYGKENFRIYNILLLPDINFILCVFEILFIWILKSHVSVGGYNVSRGGKSPMKGNKHSSESIEKIRRNSTGKHPTEETKEKIRQANIGKIVSQKTRKKISDKIKSRTREVSRETAEKISQSLLGENNPYFGRKRKNSSSKYFGVSKAVTKYKTYWLAAVFYKGKKILRKYCNTQEEAAKEYDKCVIENNLPHPLNFPN
jgi:group I intron endonuclease